MTLMWAAQHCSSMHVLSNIAGSIRVGRERLESDVHDCATQSVTIHDAP